MKIVEIFDSEISRRVIIQIEKRTFVCTDWMSSSKLPIMIIVSIIIISAIVSSSRKEFNAIRQWNLALAVGAAVIQYTELRRKALLCRL